MSMKHKKKLPKRKILVGQIGDSTLAIRRVPEEYAMENEFLGRAKYNGLNMHAEFELSDGLTGRGLLNTFIHELAHIVLDMHGIKNKHSQVYIIASAACQALLSTGILKEGELEQRLKALGA